MGKTKSKIKKKNRRMKEARKANASKFVLDTKRDK